MKLSDLQPNIGQLEGLPANPRYIETEDFEQLKLRLLRMPQYLRHNPIKVEENNINIRKSKTTAGEVIAREVYAGRNATANNADRALVKALKKAEVKLSQYKI